VRALFLLRDRLACQQKRTFPARHISRLAARDAPNGHEVERKDAAKSNNNVLIRGETGTGKRSWPRSSTVPRRARTRISSRSTARPCPSALSRRSCSATRRTPSPAPPRPSPACSKPLRAGPSLKGRRVRPARHPRAPIGGFLGQKQRRCDGACVLRKREGQCGARGVAQKDAQQQDRPHE